MSTVCLLLIVLVLLTPGLNFELVHASGLIAIHITSVDSPSVVRAGDSFSVTVRGDYQDSGPFAFAADIGETNGIPVAENTYDSGLQPPAIGKWGLGFTVQAYVPKSNEYDASGKFAWQLHAAAFLQTYEFTVTIIKPDAAPYVKVIVDAQDKSGAKVSQVSVEDSVELVSTIDYSLPAGSTLTFSFKNDPASYNTFEKMLLETDGWVRESAPLQGSGLIKGDLPGVAPADPLPDWRWDFQVQAKTSDTPPQQASDQVTLHLAVTERQDPWAALSQDESAAQTYVQPLHTFQVTVIGKYIFPGSSTGDLTVLITHPDGTTVPGGDAHLLVNLKGKGVISEIFTLTAPPTEGMFPIVPWLKLSGKFVDHMEFDINVTSSSAVASYFCRIKGVQVNNAKPPQDVTYGKPFDVQLQLKWHLSPGSTILLDLFNLNGLDLAIASDTLVAFNGDGSQVEAIQIPASAIPPHNGIWQIEAKARFLNQIDQTAGETPNGGTRIITVNVAGAPGGPSGNSDWAVTGISTSPVNPYSGADVTFESRVEVSTNDPLPQTVAVSYSLDGVQQSKDFVTYQPGMAFLAIPSPPWMPTLGQHTVRWEVDPDKSYNDPNRANNVMESTFTVTATPPPPPQPPPGQTQLPPPPAGEVFDFYVTAVPTEQTVQSPVTYLVTVNVTAGTPQPVQLGLMGAPAGVSYYFSPPSGTPGFTSTLTVTTASNVPAGSYPLTINASSAGMVRYKPLVLDVPKGPDYTLTMTPDTVQAKPGENATFNVAVSSDTGYAQYVNLLASDLPPGSTAEFKPGAVAATGQSTLTIQLSKDVAPGFYRITVVGSGVDGKRVSAVVQVQGQIPSAQTTEATVNNLAIAILGIIVAVVIVTGVLAVRRLRSRGQKVFCIECRRKIPLGTKFCPKCGTEQTERGTS